MTSSMAGAGNDTAVMFSGPAQQPDAIIDGGAGIDTLFYNGDFASSGISIDITAPITSPDGSHISGFEVLNTEGTPFDDTIVGGSANDTLWGGGGNDMLSGGTGVNEIDGGAGFNTLVFSGHLSDFTFSHAGAFILATDAVTGETDDLKNIQDVSFNNGTDTHALSDFIV